MGQWYRYHSYRYRYHLCKKWQWPFGTGTALTGTGTAGRVWGKLGFLTPFYTSFHSPTPPSPYNTNPSPFVLSHEQIRDRMFLPGFSPFRPGSFSVRSTDVVSTPHFFKSIFSVVFHCVSMDLFGWLGLVVFCSWWIRARLMVWGGSFCLNCTGPARYLWR